VSTIEVSSRAHFTLAERGCWIEEYPKSGLSTPD
jgi:hypothetical protein